MDREIKLLKNKIVKKNKIIKNIIIMENKEDNCCSICLNEMVRNIIITHCGHKFHRNCLRPSIKKCPMCRSQLFHNNAHQLIADSNNGMHYEGNFFACKYRQKETETEKCNYNIREILEMEQIKRMKETDKIKELKELEKKELEERKMDGIVKRLIDYF